MKLSIFCPFDSKTPIHAPKIGVLGVFHPQNGDQYQTKHPKGTSAGHNGSRRVLIMSVSSIVPEKWRGNKKCDEEEEEEEDRYYLYVYCFYVGGVVAYSSLSPSVTV